MPALSETTAYVKLLELAKTPYDLTDDSLQLLPARLGKYRLSGAGLKLSYGTERIDDNTLSAFQELADECRLVEQFHQMCEGQIFNKIDNYPSENRQALHTACRDIFKEQPMAENVTRDAKAELDKLKLFLARVDSGEIANAKGENFITMVQVGIGGSDLGPRAICEALGAYAQKGYCVQFISNVDPGHAQKVLANLDLSRTLFNIVSKSGNTQETQANESIVKSYLKVAGLDPALHCVAVTGKGSPMDNKEIYLESFYLYDCIGGRYSSTSMVGCVALGFLIGFDDLLDFLRGASEMDRHAMQKNVQKNIPLLMALIGIWNHNFLNYNSVAVIPYIEAMASFPRHLQQCDMESNGKSIDRQGNNIKIKSGPVVWGGAGTNGQHAYFQLFHQGSVVVPVEFIGFAKEQVEDEKNYLISESQTKLTANILAQNLALAVGRDSENPNKKVTGNKPSLLLAAEKLTPMIMGSILACYEAKIVFQGFTWNINSFDQEGVTLGKELACKILEEMAGADKKKGSFERVLVDWFLDKRI
ncbi:MAG: glucose-6-phosphate isomerase [Desulfotalea sp.]